MYSNLSLADKTLSDAADNARLHDEAIGRYNHMFSGGTQPSLNDIRPSLVEARFNHLANVVAQERHQGEQLIFQAMSQSRPH